MKLLIFGGTTEGRLLAQALSKHHIPAAVSVATPLGAEELAGLPGITPLVGRKTAKEMAQLFQEYDHCVDATHPYATAVSQEIKAACTQAGVPLRRLLRAESPPAEGHRVDTPEQAAQFLAQQKGNILLAIGAKHISAFSMLEPSRLYPRVLPIVESLTACIQAKIPTRNILALYGPFSQAMNEAMLTQYHIQWMVTKDGGSVGGMNEKVAAAQNTGTKLVLIGRPPETGDSFAEILTWIMQRWEEQP